MGSRSQRRAYQPAHSSRSAPAQGRHARRGPSHIASRGSHRAMASKGKVTLGLAAGSVTVLGIVMPLAWADGFLRSPTASATSEPTLAEAASVATTQSRIGTPRASSTGDQTTARLKPQALTEQTRRSTPPVSRSGPRERAAQQEESPLPEWLAGCRTAPQVASEPNGQISDTNLCQTPDGFHFRGDAAKAWWQLSERYEERFDVPVCLTDAYRSLTVQQRLYSTKAGLAARPGTSNHGWGVAVDLCGGAEYFSSDENEWLSENAGSFGWINPSWAQSTGSKPEPWHWEYVGVADASF